METPAMVIATSLSVLDHNDGCRRTRTAVQVAAGFGLDLKVIRCGGFHLSGESIAFRSCRGSVLPAGDFLAVGHDVNPLSIVEKAVAFMGYLDLNRHLRTTLDRAGGLKRNRRLVGQRIVAQEWNHEREKSET